MKKLLTLAAVAILILGLTTASYAVEFRANGFIKNFATMGVNLGWPAGFPGPASTAYNDSFAWNMIWTHLDLTLEASEDLKGVITFEAGPADWGAAGSHGAWYPGFTANVYQAFTHFKIPGTDAFPTRMVVGLQPWFFTSGLAIAEFGPGVRLNSTLGPAAVSVFWRKHEEGNEWRSDDMDSYGASVNVPVGPVSISAWEMYYKIREDAADDRTVVGVTGSTGFHSYTGLGMRGTFGPVGVTGDFVYGMREVDYSTTVGVSDDESVGGWVARVDASIPVGMFTVGGGFMYATGDDLNDVATKREWSGYKYPIPARNYFALNVATLGDVGLVYFKSYTMVFPGLTGTAGGDWYARGFARFKPLDWLTVSLNAMYIGDNVDNGDKLGDARDAAGNLEDNSDIGIEVDVVATIKIYDNLNYEIGAGYLSAGDALDRWDAATGTNDSPDDPWVILSCLTYAF